MVADRRAAYRPADDRGRGAAPRFRVRAGRRPAVRVGERRRAAPCSRSGRRAGRDSDAARLSLLECRGRGWHRARRGAQANERLSRMITLDPQQQTARDWFESLRTRICAEFEAIEAEAGSDARFSYTPWDREAEGLAPGEGGGGVRGVMTGRVFEKVGVNVSTVAGQFAPDFAASIHGAGEDPSFFATGISLVAHMANPHVPAVHMNTRFLATTKRWFGGSADLNPPIP